MGKSSLGWGDRPIPVNCEMAIDVVTKFVEGASASMRPVEAVIRELAQSDVPVLLLAERGAHVRFQTQEFDLSLPEEGDIYIILKYLALVSPMRGKPPAAPDDPTSFQIVFSANLERMAALGWGIGEGRGARLLGVDAFTSTVSSPKN